MTAFQARALLVFVVGVLVAVTVVSSARGSSLADLRQREHRVVARVEQAKTTIRFFERHPALLYRASTKKKAWRDVGLARQRVILGRAELRRIRALIRRQTVQSIPHLREWLCIHQYEGAWTDPDAPYYGGLQMDREFQRTYGLDFYRAKGTADHWTPREQMLVAERAWKTRGFWPWPNTARRCGLL